LKFKIISYRVCAVEISMFKMLIF